MPSAKRGFQGKP
jgi:hypothetical protein